MNVALWYGKVRVLLRHTGDISVVKGLIHFPLINEILWKKQVCLFTNAHVRLTKKRKIKLHEVAFYTSKAIMIKMSFCVVTKHIKHSSLTRLRQMRKQKLEEEAKSREGMSIPISFVFSTIQFTPVHLHLCYFHSNSRGAIKSIFDIGTWLWKGSCHFAWSRCHFCLGGPL